LKPVRRRAMFKYSLESFTYLKVGGKMFETKGRL